MKQISIDSLNKHLFEAIEMLKNNSDPEADAKEKIDIETAKTIAELGKVVIEGYKTKVSAMHLLTKAENPEKTTEQLAIAGFIPEAPKPTA